MLTASEFATRAHISSSYCNYSSQSTRQLFHPAKPQHGDFRYSGMHDTGILDEPREGGPVALLVHTVLQAKEYNDAYLTAVIEAEKAESLCTESASYDSTTKKMKVSKT